MKDLHKLLSASHGNSLGRLWIIGLYQYKWGFIAPPLIIYQCTIAVLAIVTASSNVLHVLILRSRPCLKIKLYMLYYTM